MFYVGLHNVLKMNEMPTLLRIFLTHRHKLHVKSIFLLVRQAHARLRAQTQPGKSTERFITADSVITVFNNNITTAYFSNYMAL